MQTEEGLTLTLSPVQMAAILRGKTISEGETMSNRLWAVWALLAALLKCSVLAFCAWFLSPQCYLKRDVLLLALTVSIP